MFPRVAGPRRLAGISLLVLLTWIVVLWIVLPYDNSLVLFMQFSSSRLAALFRSSTDDERLVLDSPGLFPFTEEEVAYVVKTGYGTQERLPALLEASKSIGTGTKYAEDNILVVGDFAGKFEFQGRPIVIHDMVAAAVENEAILGATQTRDTDRMQKYRNMTAAIQNGDKEEAARYSKAVGWELDALKFIPSLQLAWKQLPGRKWYILQDDDTFMIRPSLYRFLEHLNPAEALYLGNAIGDYKARFAHGGSSFILSNKAMSRLLDDSPQVVADAYIASLDETWGDRLVATTLLRVGIYLSERYGHFFNGERPLITKLAADRICSPLVSFHGLARPQQMKDVGKTFATIDRPVFWHDLWRIYGQPGLDAMAERPIRAGRDHVGSKDDPVVHVHAATAEACIAACSGLGVTCLAWTWDKASKRCAMSPWVIVGEEEPTESFSGLNVKEMMRLESQCGRTDY
ncbi:hypothetical protein BD289DRAFT_442893 [Coniella lustricola]|uniref:N-acetylgalactosaminide beta-1,3-galactosyltransferase n=1 Tax=Coniella lustricola TaxID=2025994 RepID=A0A2T2ZXP2_9PEZI|nr:hypothetical protein BD289DRAFT_442893 [Coniella lustricola]